MNTKTCKMRPWNIGVAVIGTGAIAAAVAVALPALLQTAVSAASLVA